MSRHLRTTSWHGDSMPVSMGHASSMYHPRLSVPNPTQSYYSDMQETGAPTTMDGYDAYTGTAPPVSHPISQTRVSSTAWEPKDDAKLVEARQQGLNWGQIQLKYFSSKTPNACRKRHERLMERKGMNEWDRLRSEKIAKAYMANRKAIWAILAAETGEKCNVLEQWVLGTGLKNIQSLARAAARRERLETGGFSYNDDDSGIDGIDSIEEMPQVEDMETAYSSPEPPSSQILNEASHGGPPGYPAGLPSHMQPLPSYYSHGYHSSVSSTGTNPSYTMGHGRSHSMGSPYVHDHQRLPSVDMGISSIMNRAPSVVGGSM